MARKKKTAQKTAAKTAKKAKPAKPPAPPEEPEEPEDTPPDVVTTDDLINYQLNHHCNKPGCVGRMGDLIPVTEENAQWLDARNGGQRVDVEFVEEQTTATASVVDDDADAIDVDEEETAAQQRKRA